MIWKILHGRAVILSALGDKIRIPKRPCNFCLFYLYWWNFKRTGRAPRLLKATILVQAWTFSSVCWKLCCFLLPFSHAIFLQLSTSHSFPALFTSKVPYHPVHIFTFRPAHALRIQWLLPFPSGIGLKLLTSLITARPFSYISSVRHSIMCDPPHGSAT